jgi:hypothetical protein
MNNVLCSKTGTIGLSLESLLEWDHTHTGMISCLYNPNIGVGMMGSHTQPGQKEINRAGFGQGALVFPNRHDW